MYGRGEIKQHLSLLFPEIVQSAAVFKQEFELKGKIISQQDKISHSRE